MIHPSFLLINKLIKAATSVNKKRKGKEMAKKVMYEKVSGEINALKHEMVNRIKTTIQDITHADFKNFFIIHEN
jgi:hypothetical protein